MSIHIRLRTEHQVERLFSYLFLFTTFPIEEHLADNSYAILVSVRRLNLISQFLLLVQVWRLHRHHKVFSVVSPPMLLRIAKAVIHEGFGIEGLEVHFELVHSRLSS